MHEVGIMYQALDLAFDTAKRESASRITSLTLRIGALAGVVPEALKFAFDVVSQGTMAEGAEFKWEELPTLCRCPKCELDFAPEGYVFTCPTCGERSADIRQGRELSIAEIEVEVPDE